MTLRTSTIVIIAGLFVAGGWGVWKISENSQSTGKHDKIVANTEPVQRTTVIEGVRRSKQQNSPGARENRETSAQSVLEQFSNIQTLLDRKQFNQAVSSANTLYSSLDTNQAQNLSSLFLEHANTLSESGKTGQAVALLKTFTQLFDDISAWQRLGQLATQTKDWNTALNAYLKYSFLEHRPESFDFALKELTKLANLQRNDLQKNGDHISVRALYQRLYEAHPTYPRFQLSLAESHLRLNDTVAATTLLEALQYDPELGNLAQQILDQIRNDAQDKQPQTVAKKADNDFLPSDIVVPLSRQGTSFIATLSFNNKPARLLLDTGASITSMSSNVISRLGFEPIGRSIQISTANGVTDAPLYRAKNIRLGRFKIDALVVAQIDLGNENQFQGLLGTDLLNRVNENYAYVIDNQQSALIFRRR